MNKETHDRVQTELRSLLHAVKHCLKASNPVLEAAVLRAVCETNPDLPAIFQ